MTKCNVKTGDVVVVITGKDAGKQGKVLAVNTKSNRIAVEGVNMISKHQKARKAQEKSQIVKKEGTIDVSNVMIVCPTCGKPTRVKHAVVDGKSVRVCKCGATLEAAKAEKKAVKKAAAKSAEAKAEKAKAAPAEKTEAAEKKTKVVKSVKATTTSAKSTKTTTARKAQRGV
ncbi:MAG: 50S ribosomal protein L24 [Clostridia bacterium]|nr:50S ribosomal protein L24 [Clostridia bacterium]